MSNKPTSKLFLNDLTTFTLMLSAICHDVDHTGRSNDFEIKKKSFLALTYQDLSVIFTNNFLSYLAS